MLENVPSLALTYAPLRIVRGQIPVERFTLAALDPLDIWEAATGALKQQGSSIIV